MLKVSTKKALIEIICDADKVGTLRRAYRVGDVIDLYAQLELGTAVNPNV